MLHLKIIFFIVINYLCHNEAKTDLSHPCIRKCDGEAMVCEYHFKQELFYSLDMRACFDCPQNVTDCFRQDCILGGGIKRNVVSINRQVPGPAIEVCQGDVVVVTLENLMMDDRTSTIHWHGQHMRKTPYMDGVPWVNQCPVMSNTNFTYTFEAAQHGTHFWHSHDRSQRGDGMFGSLIVRLPKRQDPHRYLYDADLSKHVVIVSDWNIRMKTDVMGASFHEGIFPNPDGLLINGLGPLNMSNEQIPIAEFTVEQGKRFRFRFIDASFTNCPVSVSIDNHNVTVISSDGFNLDPETVSSFLLHNGERYDFILNADQEVGVYWMRFKAAGPCSRNKVYQLALLRYNGCTDSLPEEPRPTYEEAFIEGPIVLNDLEVDEGIKVSQMNSWEPCDKEIADPDVVPVYLGLNFENVPNTFFYNPPYYDPSNLPARLRASSPAINGVIFKDPLKPLLQSRYHYDDGKEFCSEDTLQGKNCSEEFCHCTHVIEFPLGEVVELIVYGGGTVSLHHPMHMHGGAFHVVAWESVGKTITKEQIQEMDKQGLIKRNLKYPPIKDTLAFLTGGYAVLRFKADNPGYWLYHCHIDVHSETGMRMVFKIGTAKDMKGTPPRFPTCGSYGCLY